MSLAIRKPRRFLCESAIRRDLCLRRHESGATAVEFALLIGPFMLVVLAMIYMGLNYFANAHFDTNVNTVMKRVYEGTPQCSGQPSTAPYSAACLAQRICEQPSIVLLSPVTCKSTIQVDMRKLAGDGSDSIPPLFTASGLNAGAFSGGQAGVAGDIVLVRAVVPYPSWLTWGPFVRKSNGKSYLYAAQAVRVRDMTTYMNVKTN